MLVLVIPDTHGKEEPPKKPLPTTSDIRNKPEKVGNSNGEESNAFYDGAEEDEVIEEAHKYLLNNIFDKSSWEPLPEEVYRDKTALKDRILEAIANSRWERTLPLSKTLDQTDGENRSLLHMLLTRMPTKRNSNNRSPRDSFARRKELVRFLMNEYPQLYSYHNNDNRTVLKTAYARAQVKEETLPKVFATEFIHLLVTEYPKETARELNNATSPYKAQSRGLCIQELIPVVKGLPEKLLDHLKPELVLEAADYNGNSVLHLLAEYATEATDVKALVTKYPATLSARNKSSRSPYQHRVFVQVNEDQKFNPEHDDVVKYLKDEYMHLQNPEETIQCLYGASKGMFHALGIAFISSYALVIRKPVDHTGGTNSLD